MDLNSYLTNKTKRFLVFDLDKTLLHLKINWSKYEKVLWKKIEHTDPEMLQSGKDKFSSLTLLQNVYVKRNGPEALDYILELNREFEAKNLKRYEANQDLVDFVANNQNYTYYLWTANTRGTAEKVLKELSILDRFEKLVTRDDVEMLKPDPEGFGLMYNKTEPKDSYLFLGDATTDRKAAELAKIDFYLVDTFK